MLKVVFLTLIFSSFSYADMDSDSPEVEVMLKYPESQKAFNDLNSTYFDVQILYLSAEEIKKRAGHDGGGIRQNPKTKNYEILLNEDLSPEGRAHSITHELEHIRHELINDKFLNENPELNAMGSVIVKGFKGPNREKFITENKPLVNFVVNMLFCSERKAYQRNINLVQQGLGYQPEAAIKTPGKYIAKHYVEQTFGITMSDKEIVDAEKRCLTARSHRDFLKSIAPDLTKTSAVAARKVSVK